MGSALRLQETMNEEVTASHLAAGSFAIMSLTSGPMCGIQITPGRESLKVLTFWPLLLWRADEREAGMEEAPHRGPQ